MTLPDLLSINDNCIIHLQGPEEALVFQYGYRGKERLRILDAQGFAEADAIIESQDGRTRSCE